MKPIAPSLAGLSQNANSPSAAAAAGLLFAVSGAQAQALRLSRESIIPIAALTAEGDAARLKTVLADALNRKSMTVNEMKDVLQMYAYTGFPRSLTGLGVLVNLLDERHAAGITDEKGREATPLPAGTNIRELGTKTQTELVGRPVKGPVYDFSPEIDTYLKEHLFGDIFSSDLLTHQERELATISALASLPAPVQLRSHLNASLNVGLSPKRCANLLRSFGAMWGSTEAALAQTTLDAVLAQRAAK